jgi:histidyl-tRNA synthetase
MESLNLFPEAVEGGTQVLFFNLGQEENQTAYTAMTKLRAAGISCEIVADQTKMDKQFKYAEKKNISRVVIIGAQELVTGTCNVKNLGTGEQVTIPLTQLNEYFS